MYLTEITESTNYETIKSAIDADADCCFDKYQERAYYRSLAVNFLAERNKLIDAMRLIEEHAEEGTTVKIIAASCLSMAKKDSE